MRNEKEDVRLMAEAEFGKPPLAQMRAVLVGAVAVSME
jgi:hypothetical protein